MGAIGSSGSTARWTLIVVALVFPTIVAWLYFVELQTGGGAANPALQMVYSGGKGLQFALPLLAVVVLERRWPRLKSPTSAGLAIGVGFALLVTVAILALYFGFLKGSEVLARTPAMLKAKLEEFGLATPLGFIGLAVFLSVIHSLAEEYYWRWFVFGQLQRLLPLGPALVISSLGFMGHHVVVLAVYFPGHFWTAALPFSLCIAIGGGFWAWLYHRTGTLYAPWLSHLLVDAAIMTIGYALVFGAP
jgi:membrane protease YdiL (CAAX protease family)